MGWLCTRLAHGKGDRGACAVHWCASRSVGGCIASLPSNGVTVTVKMRARAVTISQNGNSVTPDSREENDAMCFFSCVHDALSLTPS